MSDNPQDELREATTAYVEAEAHFHEIIGANTTPLQPNTDVTPLEIDWDEYQRRAEADRRARIRYAAALKAVGWTVPHGLLWDVPEDQRP